MKIKRSTKCTLKYVNKHKRENLSYILLEYGKVVNCFIKKFWDDCPVKSKLLKPIVDSVESWFSFALRQVAAREAIDMIKTARKRDGKEAVIPAHKGKRMRVNSTISSLQLAKRIKTFDCFLHLRCIGKGIIIDLPIKLHKHFNELQEQGKKLNSYIITKDYVQFCFEIETGPKRTEGESIGVDSGINALASLSNGSKFGTDMKSCIERVKRCKNGSKGQKKARRALKQRMDEVAKEVVKDKRLVVAEKLKKLNYKTKVKHRLTKNIRRSIGIWAYRAWLDKLKRACEIGRSAFRSVCPAYTSQMCSNCGHVDRRNRSHEKFLCRKCGYADNADINAAKNILDRFLCGPYGVAYKLAMNASS